jgi:hypothetical protein
LNKIPLEKTADISSLYLGDDYAYFAVCPPNGQASTNIYISLDCYHPENGTADHTLLVTTRQSADTWKPIPIVSLPAYAAVSELVNTIKIYPDNATFACDAWAWTCNEMWAYSTAANVNPIYPLPAREDPYYRYMKLNVSADTGGVANTFKFVVLLNSSFPNFTKNFDESDLKSLRVEMMAFLSNQAGDSFQKVYYTLQPDVPTTVPPMASTVPPMASTDQNSNAVAYFASWILVIAFLLMLG